MDSYQRFNQSVSQNREKRQDGLDQPQRCSKNSEPLNVTNAIVYGDYYRNLDDSVPSMGCFSSKVSRGVRIECGDGIEAAQSAALCEFEQLVAEFSERAWMDDNFEPTDGLFCPLSVCLVDQFGSVLARYENDAWVDYKDLPDESEWESLLIRANQLEKMAFFESSQDNFTASQSLRDRASRIRQDIEIAKNYKNVK